MFYSTQPILHEYFTRDESLEQEELIKFL